ncbi:hypothetical protein AeMF1_017261 [Aphanomyces euteiches]|nr:hypothetical protein AeMF1_017261 [Aphanomyces euteiches]KAH9181192.1 hypothetical protein AeNC1_016833 [Aphanomyces euteiches]
MLTSNHPESDGQTERANRASLVTLCARMRMPVPRRGARFYHKWSLRTIAAEREHGIHPILCGLSSPSTAPSFRLSGGRWQAAMHSPGWEPAVGVEEPPARTIASVKHFAKLRESVRKRNYAKRRRQTNKEEGK